MTHNERTRDKKKKYQTCSKIRENVKDYRQDGQRKLTQYSAKRKLEKRKSC